MKRRISGQGWSREKNMLIIMMLITIYEEQMAQHRCIGCKYKSLLLPPRVIGSKLSEIDVLMGTNGT